MSKEWLTENVNRRFPFAEASADANGIDLDALSNWVVDLRVFVSPYEEVDCWISALTWYDGELLTLEGGQLTFDGATLIMATGAVAPDGLEFGVYSIELSNSSGVIATLGFPIRNDPAASDIQKKLWAAQGPIVAFISPGEGWEDHSALGLVNGVTLTFTTPEEIESTRVHPTNVNTGIRSFKGFYLAAPYYDSDGVLIEVDETMPSLGEQPAVSFNRLQAGYNIELEQDGDDLNLNLVSGAGEGLYPCDELECKPKVRSVNGLGPNEQGNITLDFLDCLRHSGRTDTDAETGLPNIHGLKIYSDCLPCCSCGDYDKSSRAISRMSAKFRDVNLDMNQVMIDAQTAYDEALAIINSRAAGMAVIFNWRILADRIEINVVNNANVPIYAILAINTTGSAITLEADQSHVLSGVVTAIPPLSGLISTEQGSGVTDINDVDNWSGVGDIYTVGSEDGGALQPAENAKVVLFIQSARDKLDALADICPNLQILLGGTEGQEILDNDPVYAALLSEFNTASTLDAECLDTTGLNDDPVATDDEDFDRAYKCQVQAQGDAIRKQELRDLMLAQKYDLATDFLIGGVSVRDTAMQDVIDALRALPGMVATSCKDGTHTCEDQDTSAGSWDWSCSAPVYGESCQTQIRKQNKARAEVYADLEKALRDQINNLREKLIEELRGGMFADLVDKIDISTAAVYGSVTSLGCIAGNYEIPIERRTQPDDGFDCLSQVISIVATATSEPISPPESPPLPIP